MTTTQVGAKKSLFRKPAWASTVPRSTDEETPIFGQAHLYQEIVEQDKQRREKHAARQKERAEKQKSEVEERKSKRQRVSKDAEDSDYGSEGDVKSTRSASVSSHKSHHSSVSVSEEKPDNSKGTSPKRKTRLVDQLDAPSLPKTRSQKARATNQDEAIVLEDDDASGIDQREDDAPSSPQRKPSSPQQKSKQPEPEPVSESDEEDEYLRELKNKARQEARSQALVVSLEREATPGSPTRHVSIGSHSSGDLDSKSSVSRRMDSHNGAARSTVTPAPENQDEVKIWIKTLIPNAKEVIVNRKISQPLDKVKEFWIKRNEIDPVVAEKIFFTWNGTRLYNSTTMRGIIQRLKKTHPTQDGSDPSDGRITLEAVTDEIFEYRRQQRARRLAEAEASLNNQDNQSDSHDPALNSNNGENATGENDASAPQPPKPGIVIKLKAQGLEEMSLRVRPHTTMRKILGGFCTVKKVEPNVQSWLSYDGDRLDEHATVEDVGFEHEDTVEVYLRS